MSYFMCAFFLARYEDMWPTQRVCTRTASGAWALCIETEKRGVCEKWTRTQSQHCLHARARDFHHHLPWQRQSGRAWRPPSPHLAPPPLH